MILFDHNIPEQQLGVLRRARLRPQQIGRDVGCPQRGSLGGRISAPLSNASRGNPQKI